MDVEGAVVMGQVPLQDISFFPSANLEHEPWGMDPTDTAARPKPRCEVTLNQHEVRRGAAHGRVVVVNNDKPWRFRRKIQE